MMLEHGKLQETFMKHEKEPKIDKKAFSVTVVSLPKDDVNDIEWKSSVLFSEQRFLSSSSLIEKLS